MSPRAALLLLLSACHAGASDGGDTDAVDTDVADTEVDTAPPADTDPGTASCDPPGFGGGEPSVDVSGVDADLVDGDGAALAGVPVSITGLDLALQGTTTADGHAHVEAGRALKAPAFVFGDGLTVARFALPLGQGASDLGVVHTGRLPAQGAALVPGDEAASGGVRLRLAADVAVFHDTLTYPTPADEVLRAVRVDDGAAVLGPDLAGGVLYGLAPLGSTICPPAAVTVPNSAGWPADAAVAFWIQGLDVGQGFAPFGGWRVVSPGVVSHDGATVSTSPGHGFPVLAPFAVRLAD